MKKKKSLILLTCLFAALLTGFALIKPGYYLYRELSYQWGDPSEAEQIVHTYAKEMDVAYGSYPVDLIELLETNPETESFVLGFPFRETANAKVSYDRSTVPLFLQWDPSWGYERYGSSYLAVTGCGPTCLAMAGYYLTGDEAMLPDKIAAFAESNGYYAKGYGSSWTLISEGSRALGLAAQELPLVKKKMITALEEGSPIILALGEGDFTTAGHYIVLTGVEDGAFRVNDPNSIIRSERLWTYEELEDQIRNIWVISR